MASRRESYWGQVEAAKRLASIKGTRFADDSPAKRVRRMAEAIVLPERFNAIYLPHYFRGEPSPVHGLLYLVLAWEHHAAVRIPRGFAKSTTVTFAYPLHQVVCAPYLRALREGTLAATHPELAAEVDRVMREEARRRIAAGPLTTRTAGLPDHWDPSVNDALDAWLASVHARQVELGDRLLIHWDPFIQIVAVDLDLALEFTGSIRKELELNDLIRSDFGDLAPCKTGDWNRRVKRQASDEDFESNEVRVAAYSMQEEIRGGKHGAYRPTLAIFDDPDGEKTSRTINQRDQNEQMIAGAVENGLEPGVGRVMVCGTPHHPDCVVVRLTERDENKAHWVAFRFRARDEVGGLLWPSRFSAEVLADKFRRNPERAEPELDDRPPSVGGRKFKRIHYYPRALWDGVPLPKVLAFDPSYGQKKTSDFQALVALRGPTPEPVPRILVHRAVFLRIGDPEELIRAANAVYDEEDPDLAAIEAIALGALLQVMLMKDGRRSGLFPSWKRIERHEEAKELRITSLAPLVNEGILVFPDDGSCRQLEVQFLQNGDPGVKRDGPDVTHMALTELRQLGHPRRISHVARERGELLRDRTDWSGERRERRLPFGRLPETRRGGW